MKPVINIFHRKISDIWKKSHSHYSNKKQNNNSKWKHWNSKNLNALNHFFSSSVLKCAKWMECFHEVHPPSLVSIMCSNHNMNTFDVKIMNVKWLNVCVNAFLGFAFLRGFRWHHLATSEALTEFSRHHRAAGFL